jgi:hypothetical protein
MADDDLRTESGATVTNGELYRTLLRLETSSREDLSEIKDRLRIQNGRVAKTEDGIANTSSDVAVLTERVNSLHERLGGSDAKAIGGVIAGGGAALALIGELIWKVVFGR